MAEYDNPIKKHSIGGAPTVEPKPSHGGRRFAAGDVILGRYVVESELGQGGMGVVYKCLDQVGGVKVAVKGLPPDVAHNEGEMEEIRANFQLVCDLRHENIAGVRTLEKDASGDYYLVMDLAHGDDLGSWIRKNKDADLKVRLSIIRQIASALDYAHRRKVMHRDIKPGNIMVSPSGRVQLLDFGLAAQISTSLSRTSHMVVSQSGTPAYKSPEQWRGMPQGAAADQYALAVVAYRLLSGRLPFDGDNVLILCRAVLEERPPAIKYLPSHANKAFARALAKEPHDRFPNCTAFVDALEGKSRPGGFWRILLTALLPAGVILAVGGIWLHLEKKSPQPITVGTNTMQPPTAETNTPPGKVESPTTPTNAPPGKVEPPTAETNAPQSKVEPPPTPTNAPPDKVEPPPPTNAPSSKVEPPPTSSTNVPPIGASSQFTIEQETADRARFNAKKEQKRAIDAGINVQHGDYQAACDRMKEAENLYVKGDYKQAIVKFNQAEEQFRTVYGKAAADGKATASEVVLPLTEAVLPSSAAALPPPSATIGRMPEEEPPLQRPTVKQINADRTRLNAEKEQKRAIDAGINVQNGAYQAACDRMKEAENLYEKGDYKQAAFKFSQAADQFSRIHEQKQ